MFIYFLFFILKNWGELGQMKKKIVVNDKMQKGYVYYLTEPEGKNFDLEFRPELTPKQMLRLGIFGGVYMRDCVEEFGEHLKGAKLAKGERDFRLNFFGVDASKPLSYWREKGWIHMNDPRGWFQWYCRYYKGRRGSDDFRQIGRWKAFARHAAQLKRNCPKGAWNCRARQRQALLHWGYDSRVM